MQRAGTPRERRDERLHRTSPFYDSFYARTATREHERRQVCVLGHNVPASAFQPTSRYEADIMLKLSKCPQPPRAKVRIYQQLST